MEKQINRMETLKNTKSDKPKFRERVLIYVPKRREWVIASFWPQDQGSKLGAYFVFHDGAHAPSVDGDVYWMNLPPKPKAKRSKENSQ